VLDPCISYDGLRADAADDPSALVHIDTAKRNLHEHYLGNYTKKSPRPLQNQLTPTTFQNGSPQKVDFLSRYNRSARTDVDEVEEYFKLLQENFATCDPVQWWSGCHVQFPNLL
jgi:hypothetical protein